MTDATRPRSADAVVLDTSVLVHDPNALFTFYGTTVVIPIFVVMELDDLKTSKRSDVAAAARAASRNISTLMTMGNLHGLEGVWHDELESLFYVWAGDQGPSLRVLRNTDSKRKMDLYILKSALSFAERYPEQSVTVLTKDINLRILANFEGLKAHDYDKDKVHLNKVSTGIRVAEDLRISDVQLAFTPGESLQASSLGLNDLTANEFVVVREDDREVALRYDAGDGALHPAPKEFKRQTGIEPRNVEQRVALSLLMDPNIQLVTLVGKAGTGKTFLALAAALAQLSMGGGVDSYDRLLLSKPVVPMGNDIGFLPGNFDEKMQPWMMSFFDNLDQLISSDDTMGRAKGADRNEKGWEILFANGQIEVQAIHSIRGRSISQAFMIIDEAQNLTPHEVKTIITRAAEGTKVVLLGDPFQVDNPFLDQNSNGLVYVAERLKDSPMTGTVFFSKGERSALAELAATKL